MANEDLIRPKGVPVGASCRWVGDPLPGRGLYQLAQHASHPTTSNAAAAYGAGVKFRDYWSTLGCWAKALFWGSIVSGIVCVLVGLWGDHQKFWQHWGFGANFFSSFTGALFGVPFAAILVTWFTTSQERRMAQGPIKTLSANAWAEFKGAAGHHAAMIPPASLRDGATQIAESVDAIRGKVAAVSARNPNAFDTIPSKRVPFDWGTDEAGSGFTKDMNFMISEAKKLGRGIESIATPLEAIGSPSSVYNRAWGLARNRWQFLNSTVRAERLGADLGWGMPAAAEQDLVFRFDSELSPVHRTLVALLN